MVVAITHTISDTGRLGIWIATIEMIALRPFDGFINGLRQVGTKAVAYQ
jgi:hypothetical protein